MLKLYHLDLLSWTFISVSFLLYGLRKGAEVPEGDKKGVDQSVGTPGRVVNEQTRQVM